MYFPVTCVDNFYTDPEYVARIAREADYTEIHKNWPGYRTKFLHITHPKLFDTTCKKIFSLFYSTEDLGQISWNVEMSFQKIVPIEHQNNLYPDGWVHYDTEKFVAGVIYLYEDTELNTGTSIYTPKNPIETEYGNIKTRDEFHTNTITDFNLYNKIVQENNEKFEETVTVKNKFNRLIMYDGSHYHAAKNINRLEQPRYTIVFFVNKLLASRFPIPQARRFYL